MTKHKNFLKSYLNSFSEIIKYDENVAQKFVTFLSILKKLKKNNKVHIFGNGGSSTIANHFSMDLSNNSKIRCFNYNDPAVITCFSNDFDFNKWISKSINKYGDRNDLLILISSSGESLNMINAAKMARKKKFDKIITFTGFKKNNKLSKLGDINFWINSNDYNKVESAHNLYLLLIVDLIKKN